MALKDGSKLLIQVPENSETLIEVYFYQKFNWGETGHETSTAKNECMKISQLSFVILLIMEAF